MTAADFGYGPRVGTDQAYALHHVLLAIPPGGEDAARAFFVGVLGMTEVEKPVPGPVDHVNVINGGRHAVNSTFTPWADGVNVEFAA